MGEAIGSVPSCWSWWARVLSSLPVTLLPELPPGYTLFLPIVRLRRSQLALCGLPLSRLAGRARARAAVRSSTRHDAFAAPSPLRCSALEGSKDNQVALLAKISINNGLSSICF